jgi:hypothetical protein
MQQSFPNRSVLILLFLASLTAFGSAQDQRCAELRAAKKEIYGFHPARLTEQQQRLKERQIDRFWGLAESQGQRGITCLRKMLRSETNDSFFLFDGAGLLLHLDDSQPSLTVVSDAAERSDLGDLNPAGYVELALELAQHGIDTGALADKYMKYPKVDGYVAEHSLPVDRATGAIFLYGSMLPDLADKYLVPLLNSKEPETRGTAALQLALNMTRDSYRALAGLPGIDSLPKQTREQVIAAMAYHAPSGNTIPTYSREQVLAHLRALPRTQEQMEAELKKEKTVTGIANDEPFIRSAIATLNAGDLDAVRESRRAALIFVSDESLYEYMAHTRIILGVINRLDLHREFRVH